MASASLFSIVRDIHNCQNGIYVRWHPVLRSCSWISWPDHFLYFCSFATWAIVNPSVIRGWWFIKKINNWEIPWVLFIPPDPIFVLPFALGSWPQQIISPGSPCSLVSCRVHHKGAMVGDLGLKRLESQPQPGESRAASFPCCSSHQHSAHALS